MSVRKLPHKPDEPGVVPPAAPDEAGAGHAADDSLEPRVLPSGLAPRVTRAFAAPRAGRAALIPYLTGGHPSLETSHLLIATLIDAGADIVELGIPFSDPIADGPVVQQSTHAALLSGDGIPRRGIELCIEAFFLKPLIESGAKVGVAQRPI